MFGVSGGGVEAEKMTEFSANYYPVKEIAGHPEALYLWHERVGIWLDSGLEVTPGMLAHLRNGILRDCGLSEIFKARIKGGKGK